MEPLNIFESLVWKGHYTGNLSELQHQSKILLTTSPRLNTGLERDGGVSSSSDANYPHNWEESKDFLNWLRPYSDLVWSRWGYPSVNRMFTNSWANLHPSGAWTDTHNHGLTKQVIVLYLDQPENGGNLELQNPLFYHWQGYFQGQPEWIEVPVQTGDVIIFPGWLLHRSQKNNSDSNRMVMSFNLNG
jgi:hypothetical protein